MLSVSYIKFSAFVLHMSRILLLVATYNSTTALKINVLLLNIMLRYHVVLQVSLSLVLGLADWALLKSVQNELLGWNGVDWLTR